MESGLPNGKERTECERQGQQQPLVETCRLTARKLAASPAQEEGEAGPTASRMPGSSKEAGMVPNDSHLLRSPVEPGWWATIHGQAAPGPPGSVTEQPVFPVLRHRRQLPLPLFVLEAQRLPSWMQSIKEPGPQLVLSHPRFLACTALHLKNAHEWKAMTEKMKVARSVGDRLQKTFAKGSWDPEQGRDTTSSALEINRR